MNGPSQRHSKTKKHEFRTNLATSKLPFKSRPKQIVCILHHSKAIMKTTLIIRFLAVCMLPAAQATNFLNEQGFPSNSTEVSQVLTGYTPTPTVVDSLVDLTGVNPVNTVEHKGGRGGGKPIGGGATSMAATSSVDHCLLLLWVVLFLGGGALWILDC